MYGESNGINDIFPNKLEYSLGSEVHEKYKTN